MNYYQRLFDTLRLVSVLKDKEDYSFVHFNRFDNSKAQKEIIFPAGTIHAWCVPNRVLLDFCKTYQDGFPMIVDPKGYIVYAINYKEMDKFVLDLREEVPDIYKFDVRKHAITYEEVWTDCGPMIYFQNEYQVILVPKDKALKYSIRYRVYTVIYHILTKKVVYYKPAVKKYREEIYRKIESFFREDISREKEYTVEYMPRERLAKLLRGW